MANGEGRISFPKWALAFVVPAVVVIVMFGVNNYRQGRQRGLSMTGSEMQQVQYFSVY
jgi:hypothetical protein